MALFDYDVRWAALFERASAELSEALGPAMLRIHHVGSTSVPGMCAKPILDILVSIPHFERGRALVPSLADLGYEFRPDEDTPDRHYFRRRIGSRRTHHLSLAEPASHHHVVTLAFRDALRADPVLASAYADLKRRLAERFPRDRESYLRGKSGFVADVLARAGLA